MPNPSKRPNAVRAELEFLETFVGPPKSAAAGRGMLKKIENRKAEVESILETERIFESFAEEQRTEIKAAGISKKIPQQTDRTRFEAFEKKAARPFYYLQKAFSKPEDYREALFRHEKQLLPLIVVDPNRVSPALLSELGIFPNTRPQEAAGLVWSIKILKTLFPKLRPLRVGEGGVSARISTVSDPWKPWHGKLLSFQNLTEYAIDGADRDYRHRSVTVRAHADLFSAARSQMRAATELADRVAFCDGLRNDLDAMIREWKRSGPTPELMEKLSGIGTRLGRKEGYLEARALNNRISRIDGKHRERDWQRLVGAYNDLSKSMRAHVAKMRHVAEQEELIRLEAKMESGRFRHLLAAFFRTVAETDQSDIERAVAETPSPLPPETKKRLESLRWSVREYLDNSEGTASEADPFAWVRTGLSDRFSLYAADGTDRTEIKFALSCSLFLKESRLRIWSFEAEDALKRSDFSETVCRTVRTEAEKLVPMVERATFLPNVALPKKTDDRFATHAGRLRTVSESEGNDALAAAVEALRDK